MKGVLRIFARVVLVPLGLLVAGVAILVALVFPGQGDLDFPTEAEQPAQVSLPDAGPMDRVAVVALFRAGFLRQVAPQMDDNQLSEVPSWMTSAYTDACTMTELTRAVLAAEGYARPAWRRALETSVASALQAVTGRVPDWSYGLGQVRLSSAEAALSGLAQEAEAVLGLTLALPEGRDALFQALQSRCSNALIVEAMLARLAPPDTPPEEMAALYRGGRSWPMLPGVVSYEGLVARIATDVLPAMREQGGEVGIVLQGARAADFVTLIEAEVATEQPTPLMCLEVYLEEIYVYPFVAKQAGATAERATRVIDAAGLAAAAEAIDPAVTRLLLVPPDAEAADELADDPNAPFFAAAEAALILNRLSLFDPRPQLLPEGPERAAQRAGVPECVGGWLVLAEGQRGTGWDATLRLRSLFTSY